MKILGFGKIIIFAAIAFMLFAAGFMFATAFGNNSAELPGTKEPAKPLEGGQEYTAQVNIVAVSSQDGTGVMSQAVVEITDGKGRVLFNLNPFTEPDTQYSAETATNVAEQYTGKSLANKDVIFEIKDSPAQLVGGPSAGAAMTVATIAAMQGKQVRQDAAITGTIQPDGTIGQIGGVIEKATAASQKGIKLFVIPQGMGKIKYYERRDTEERRGPFVLIRTQYIPRELDLIKFGNDELKIEIKEAATIDDAVKLLVQ